MFDNLPVLIVVTLLMTAFLAPLFIKKFRPLVYGVANAAVAAAACASAVLLRYALHTGPLYVAVGGWEAPWGIEVAITPLSSFVVLVVTSIVALVMVSMPREQVDWPSQKVGWYLTLVLLLTAALAGMTMANDLFNIYVFFEVTALSSFGIVAAKKERNAADAGQGGYFEGNVDIE